MANTNSFSGFYNMAQSPIPATETIVLAPGHTADTTRANSLVGLDPDLAQGGIWDGNPFRLSIAGRATVSASENITVAVYLNNTTNTNLTTFTSDIKVLNTSTMASGAAGVLSFYMSAIFVWQATSATAGRIAGIQEATGFKSISGTSAVFNSGAGTIVNSGTAISSTQSAVQFYVTGLTGTADSTSTLTIVAFTLDRV